MEINSSTLEKGIIASIIIVLCFTFFDDDEKIINEEPKILKEYFKEHPLVAWKSTDKGGDVVKIRYKINTSDRRLWIYDSDGRLVLNITFLKLVLKILFVLLIESLFVKEV